MSESGQIEVLVRGVCIVAEQILLCYNRNTQIRYLPGGHIEFCEQARTALQREIMEECGLQAEVGEFLGCCENVFMQEGEIHAEISLVFRMYLAEVEAGATVVPQEAWIGFEWHPLAELGSANFQPACLVEQLAGWIQTPGQMVSSR